ncbi:MMPL family transporter, partial [candidate division KSB1 bacterium]|nr:MMPL family transporter [candidate division KSB1 bacterium]
MRDKFLRKLADWHSDYPWRMLTIVIVLTLIFGALSSQLSVTMRWSDLLPSGDPRTVQFNKIIDEFASSTSITVVVQGEESRIKEFADAVAPRILAATDTSKNERSRIEINKLQEKILALRDEQDKEAEISNLESEIDVLRSQMNRKLINRVDYKTEVDFLRNHGLMLIKEKDLKNTKDVFLDPNLTGLLFNLNNSMEKEYIGDSESMSTREKEDQAYVFLDGIQNFIGVLQKSVRGKNMPREEVHAAVDKFLIGEPYLLSYDKKALILNAIPNFTMMDTELMVTGTDVVQSIVDDELQNFPGVTAGLTGMIPIGHDEMIYSQQSLGETTLIALVAILILLIISFRMWVAPILALANLIVGIVWAIGATAVLVGQLNIMTQMMSVILLGLGIDFSIHLISNFTEWRAAGNSIRTALEKTFLKSGKGVITGGLTTACAFLTMIISSSRGMKEMGIVTGVGLIAILLATMLFLPVLLVFRERRLDRKLAKKGGREAHIQRDISFRFLGRIGEFLGRHYGYTLIAAVIVTIMLTWAATNITFDQNYMNIEPEGLTSITLQDTVLKKFDLSMDYALILTDNVDQSRNYAEEYRKMGSVAITEDI